MARFAVAFLILVVLSLFFMSSGFSQQRPKKPNGLSQLTCDLYVKKKDWDEEYRITWPRNWMSWHECIELWDELYPTKHDDTQMLCKCQIGRKS